MPDELGYETTPPPLDRPRSSAALAAVITVFVLLLGGGALTYYYLHRPTAAAPEAPPAVPAPAAQTAPPAAPAPRPADLPALEASDPFVRERLAGLDGDEWKSWLDSDGLARRFAAAVYAVGEGKSPRRAIERPFLRGSFAVTASGSVPCGRVSERENVPKARSTR